ncbi:hypothetical protein L209DRAFT_764781 [Thermothelomyces heterothallicus CBS 203.75]
MQFSTKLVLFLTAAATGVFAGPAVDPGAVTSSQTVQDGDILYVGLDEVSSRRAELPATLVCRADTPFFLHTVCPRAPFQRHREAVHWCLFAPPRGLHPGPVPVPWMGDGGGKKENAKGHHHTWHLLFCC